jgi:hypothetical protein
VVRPRWLVVTEWVGPFERLLTSQSYSGIITTSDGQVKVRPISGRSRYMMIKAATAPPKT